MKIQIPIESFRSDPFRPWWDLPSWGHPLSQGVFPLFIVVAERLIPVGTEPVWSIGYTDLKFPEDGIDLKALDAGTFSWRSDYSHRFVVVEG